MGREDGVQARLPRYLKMTEMTDLELTEYIGEVCYSCKKHGITTPYFDFVQPKVGDPLSRDFIMRALANGKGTRIWDRDEFHEKMFDFSLSKYIAHIEVIMGYISRTVNIIVCLIETPDYSTNITPTLIEAFSKLYEIERKIQVERNNENG